MAIAERQLKRDRVLTYDDYLNEGETPGRYEIVDGMREYTTNPRPEHQVILGRLFRVLQDFEQNAGLGIALLPPYDVLVSKEPLQVKQPDLLFISFGRWGERSMSDPLPHELGPELAVEILSPSESRRQIQEKVALYAQVGVLECWLVSPDASTIELLALSASGAKRVDIYAPGQTVTSVVFPQLRVDVEWVFTLPTRSH